MPETEPDLDALQAAYKREVDAWVEAIRQEEALASVAHNIAEIDKWEAAAFHADDLRDKVKAAKAAYEDGLRRTHFDF